MLGPLANASTQPWPPHGHGSPAMSTTMCPTWPALPVGPVTSRPALHQAAADAGRDDDDEEVVDAAAGAAPVLTGGRADPVPGEPDGQVRTGAGGQPVDEREVPPGGNIDRADGAAYRIERTRGTRRRCRRPAPVGGVGERGPTRAASGAQTCSGSPPDAPRSSPSRAGGSAPSAVDQAGGHLAGPDVDGEHDAVGRVERSTPWRSRRVRVGRVITVECGSRRPAYRMLAEITLIIIRLGLNLRVMGRGATTGSGG